ncbi:hypothetical protein OPIT5_09670 [Opitutaceae bacterium TAV5]|nr:hypothetical protein OPIT5_09670 [Opitutaceae bacterium TAV5]
MTLARPILAAIAASLLLVPAIFAADTASPAGRRLTVDARLSSAEAASASDTFRSLAAAVAVLRPGDTLWIAPDSGPYREVLYIRTSGTPDASIIVEGNDNEITGFDPLAFSAGNSAAVAAPWPFVLRHNGKRIPQDASTQAFTGGITWNPDNKTLTLAPGTSPEGWEISVRDFGVRISGASHHIYRNLVATGSRNDGFNLHGDCAGLLFENITGAQNLDEGFSAHETASAEIRGARFYENDNGLLNIQQSRLVLTDADIHDNLGLGLGFNAETTVEARNVRVWGNGMLQFLLSGTVSASFENTTIYRNPHSTRPWITYQETASRPSPGTHAVARTIQWTGAKPRFSQADAP